MTMDSTKLVYESLKKKHPINICKKMREEQGMLVVNNAEYSTEIVNEIAKDFILKCNGKRTIQDIFLLLCDEYNQSEDTIVQDFLSFIRALQWKRIICIKD